MTLLGKDVSMLQIFDVILILFGIYIIFSSIIMGKSGEIASWLITEADRCKDKSGYIKFVSPKSVVFGLLLCAFGGFTLLNFFVLKLKYADMLGMVIFVAVVIWYFIILRKGKIDYFEQESQK